MSPSQSPTQAETVQAARRELLLAVADDELVTGHRASHWTGVAPSVEEDLAFATIAQDELNHADVWYQVLLAGSGGQAPRDEVDALGLGRAPEEYRHAVPCERPPGDFATTLARHWCYDHADAVRLGALADSSDPDIAAVATRLLHDERYHLEHADLWFRRLTASDPARERFADALAGVVAEAAWLFEAPIGEAAAVEAGLLAEPHADLYRRWAEGVVAALDGAGLGGLADTDLRAGRLALPEHGGRHGVHSPDFTDDVWPEMTYLYRAHPGASW